MNYAPPQRRQSTPPAGSMPNALRIGPANDAFEHQAEQVANTILSSGSASPWSLLPNTPALRRCACGASGKAGGECDECKRKKEKELQREATGPGHSAYAPPIVHQVLSAPGEPLSQSARSFFEPRFGFNLDGVRVHADTRAADSARAVQANAYAVGNHIVFGKGRYQPGSSEGRRLLAHELVHTAQQGSSARSGSLKIGSSNDAAERQAETQSNRIIGAGPTVSPGFPQTSQVQPPALRRDLSKYVKLTIPQLRKLIKSGDKEAIDALYARYQAMSNVELERYARGEGKGDQIAQDVYQKRIVPPEEGAGQGKFSKDGVRELLDKDLAAERGQSGITRRAPSAADPSVAKTEGGTVGAARTDIPGLENQSIIGRSPQAGGKVNPQSKFPPETDPLELPQTHGHAEQDIADQLEKLLEKIPREQLKGRRVWMLIEQEPCSTCAQGATNAETAAGVLKKLSLKYPELTFEIKSLDSSGLIVLKGNATAAAASGKPGEGGGEAPSGEASNEVNVGTKIDVKSAVKQPDGTTISEVEYTFGENLEQINKGAPQGGSLPSRITVRVTQNADGSIAAVESLSGEPQALVQALVQKTLAGSGAGEAAGTATGAAAAGRRLPLLFKGLKIGGWAAFAVITGYQLYNATPKGRPRVLAGAGAGLAGGALSTYVVCNLIFGLETAGWSLLFCGLAAGGLGGYAGSKAGEEVYDEATATDLDKALHRIEGQSKNVVATFNILINKMGYDGCVDAAFVDAVAKAVPSGITDTETVLLATQLASASLAPPKPSKVDSPSGTGSTGSTQGTNSLQGPGKKGTVCPGCHGRSTDELVPKTDPSTLKDLDQLVSCNDVTGKALAVLKAAVQNLPPRPQASPIPNSQGSATPQRKPGPNEHSTPPGVVLSPPTSRDFPTEAEQKGTVCPNCHAPAPGKEPWKNLGGPNGKLSDEDRKNLIDWLNAQPK